jgi:multidrug efflux system membrane fusion protein
MVLPSQAVQTAGRPALVFLVKPDNTRWRSSPSRSASAWRTTVVEKGLQSGQTVVTEGQLRLEAGTKIQTVDGRVGGGRRTRKASKASQGSRDRGDRRDRAARIKTRRDKLADAAASRRGRRP